MILFRPARPRGASPIPALASAALGAAAILSGALASCSRRDPPPLFRSDLDGFVAVEGGEFKMGDRFGNKDETSVTPVTVSSFLISDREVTRKEFSAWLEAVGRKAPWPASDLPATDLAWHDAAAYCDWLSAKTGLAPAYPRGFDDPDWGAAGYRLPTEAEGEYAARGGRFARDKAYAGGNDENEAGWFILNADGPKPVKGKAANELGLFDMSGNVWEWCWDSYGMYTGVAQADPRGAPLSGWKALRGGSWRFVDSDLRVANRYYADRDETMDDAGFRLARSVAREADIALLKRAQAARVAWAEKGKKARGSAAALAGEAPPPDAPYRNSALTPEARAKDLIARMTVEEKAGQISQAALAALGDPEEVRHYLLGTIVSGGGMGPLRNAPEEWAAMTDSLQEAALSTRLGIPMIYGIDAVHGHNNVRGTVIYPHNVGIGAAGDEALAERIGAAVAGDMLATGTRWDFAPCVAVSRDERWGRTYESYGEDPALAARMGAAFVRGLQGRSLGPDSVAATAKHFLGDGGTLNGQDRGNAVGSEGFIRATFLPPYRAAIDEGAATVMASYSSWNGVQMHANKDLLTGLLKKELGFAGVLVSDWNAHKLLPGDARQQVETTINAGVDVVMAPEYFLECRDAVVDLAKSGRIPRSRLDDAVTRFLVLKFRLGLFERPFARRELLAEIGSPAKRALGREAVRKSLVLLKNEKAALPVGKAVKRILVAGAAAHDIGAQCGGWTITWQGSNGPITPGTTILEGIAAAAKRRGVSVEYSPDGGRKNGAPVPDLVVLVLAEAPYAEMHGDRSSLLLPKADKELAKRMDDIGAPLAIVLISGRPLVVTEEIARAEAFVAAWLPGTEGDGVADVLFGESAPAGKLPFTWPRDMSQIPINEGDGKEGLYPFGYGLGY